MNRNHGVWTPRLGVNIDHVATLRQARGVEYPDILEAAQCCIRAGAHSITVHLREDRRHIQDADVWTLRESLAVPLNLEMACVPEIVKIALDVKPDEVCIVPEKREELTTEGGLDAWTQRASLAPVCTSLADAGIQVSLFIDPDPKQIEAAHGLGCPVVEFHTGTYCNASPQQAPAEIEKLIAAARLASAAGIQVNAGHGITRGNVAAILAMPALHTLNIGHSIIADAILMGLENAVNAMLRCLSHKPEPIVS